MSSSIVLSKNIALRVFTYGNSKKTPVVLVHGYPDNHTVWRAVAKLLAKHYFIITYDVRGAGKSAAPDKQEDYKMRALSEDLEAVVDSQIGDKAFHLVGHDWGSIQSWESVTAEGPLKPRILSYTTISGPCLDHMGYWLKKNAFNLSVEDKTRVLKQAVSSWYIGFFHLPLIPSVLWQLGLDKFWPSYLKHRENVIETKPNPYQKKDGRYGVQLYKANFLNKLTQPEARYTACPVQLIVPTQDNYVSTHLFDDLHHWVKDLYRRDINANHWVPLSHPEIIAQWISEFVDGVEKGKMSSAIEQAKVRPERCDLPLLGKIAVITGAGSGIGRSTAFELAEAGADIVCVDINPQSADRTAELCRALGSKAWSHTVDVGSAQAMQRLSSWTEKELGGVHIVVNNAGIGMAGGILETSTKEWEALLKVNLWGVIHGSRLFAQQMVKNQTNGHIINVASAAAFAPNRQLTAYSTSKAAVHMLSECLRAELAEKGVKVTAVCPGFVATGIANSTVYAGLDEAAQEQKRAKADALYQRRNFSPNEVAKSILKSLDSNPALSLVGTEAWITRLLSQFSPPISRKIAQIDITP